MLLNSHAVSQNYVLTQPKINPIVFFFRTFMLEKLLQRETRAFWNHLESFRGKPFFIFSKEKTSSSVNFPSEKISYVKKQWLILESIKWLPRLFSLAQSIKAVGGKNVSPFGMQHKYSINCVAEHRIILVARGMGVSWGILLQEILKLWWINWKILQMSKFSFRMMFYHDWNCNVEEGSCIFMF